ncbi:hypothetical protein ACWD04_31555 [Streptomyces sp. NPDC002911]
MHTLLRQERCDEPAAAGREQSQHRGDVAAALSALGGRDSRMTKRETWFAEEGKSAAEERVPLSIAV